MGELGALTYGRQSLGNDKSIAQQLALGRTRAERENWAHIAEYSDRISASRYATQERDQWAKLLEHLTHPDVSVLWLWESSRGDRKLSTWAGMLELCREHGVKIYVETHGRLYDMDNPRDRRTLGEDGVDSQYESDKTSDRTKRSADARAAEGRPHSGAGYGYVNLHDTRTGKFTERAIEAAEAANIAELFARIRRGHSLNAIARDWAARDIRTRAPEPCEPECTKPHQNNSGKHIAKGTPGKAFAARHLRDLAMNPAYTALRVHIPADQRKNTGIKYSLEGATEGNWEPIVSREEFYAVREILTAPERKTSRPGRGIHLLSVSTAARCGTCGGPLTASNRKSGSGNGRFWKYFCQPSSHVRITQSDLDVYAEELILDYLANPENYGAFADHSDDTEIARLRGEAAGIRSRRQELSEAIVAGMSVSVALAADARFGQQLTILEARIQELSTPDALRGLIAPGDDVRARWAAAPMSARRQIARIVLSPERAGSIRLLPNPGGFKMTAEQRTRLERAAAEHAR